MDRIVDEPGRIVAIGVTARQPEHALAEQLDQLVLHFSRLAPIPQARGESRRQRQRVIRGFQEHRAAIRTRVRSVERGDDRSRIPMAEEGQLGYTVCGHRVSSFECREASRHRFYSTCERLDGSSLSPFVNNPG